MMRPAVLTSPPGSDEWFTAAMTTANRRRWRQLLGASGAAMSASLLLLLGPATHPTAGQRVDVVSPPSASPAPGRYAAEDAPAGGPVASPTPAPSRPYRFATPPLPLPPRPAAATPANRFSPVRRIQDDSGVPRCVEFNRWCFSGYAGAQNRDGEIPLTASICSAGLAGDLTFNHDLEVDFVVENTKGQRIEALSRYLPPRSRPHVLPWEAPATCYQWKTAWSGHRIDGSRIPGAYVLRVVTKADGLIPSREDTVRFDLE